MKKRISFCLDHSIPYLLSDRIRIRSPFHPHIIDINDCLPEQEPSNFKSSTPPTQKGARGYTYYCSKIALEQYPYKYEASYARIIPHHVSFFARILLSACDSFLTATNQQYSVEYRNYLLWPPSPFNEPLTATRNIVSTQYHTIYLLLYILSRFHAAMPCHAMPRMFHSVDLSPLR